MRRLALFSFENSLNVQTSSGATSQITKYCRPFWRWGRWPGIWEDFLAG
jgi:hypothetical protein